jgi:hypothetical protein
MSVNAVATAVDIVDVFIFGMLHQSQLTMSIVSADCSDVPREVRVLSFCLHLHLSQSVTY